MYCSQCGKYLKDDSIYCSYCGYKIKSEVIEIKKKKAGKQLKKLIIYSIISTLIFFVGILITNFLLIILGIIMDLIAFSWYKNKKRKQLSEKYLKEETLKNKKDKTSVQVTYDSRYYNTNHNRVTYENSIKERQYPYSKPLFNHVNLLTKKWSGICKKSFVAIDFETTGLSPYNHKIIELSAIRYINGVKSDEFSTLINPEMRIPKSATII